VPARRAASAGLLVAAALGLAGCGTDHGQANALAACHLYASANGGGLSPSALTAKLSDAAHYAGKASKQSAQWDTLEASIDRFVIASRQPSSATVVSTALQDAKKVIDSSCEVAARGY
jgi:hypothetical protein